MGKLRAELKKSWFRAVIVSPAKPLRRVFFLSIASAVYFSVAGSNEPIIYLLRDTPVETFFVRLHIGNEIVFGSSIGYLTGVFVWFLLVWIPEQRKRETIRTNLQRNYEYFKRATLQILLHASGISATDQRIKELCDDHKEFRVVFDANDGRLWYAAINGIANEDATHLDDILVEYQIFSDELNFASNNIYVDDEFHSFARRMREIVFRLRNYTSDRYNLEKLIGTYLWEVFARWSFNEGQRDTDFFEEMIEKI